MECAWSVALDRLTINDIWAWMVSRPRADKSFQKNWMQIALQRLYMGTMEPRAPYVQEIA